MNRVLALVVFAGALTACASMPSSEGWDSATVKATQDLDGARFELVEVDRFYGDGSFAWRAMRYIVHNQRSSPLCFALIMKDAQGNLGYWDKRAVLIQPGAAGIVAEAKSSAGNYVYVAVDEWDYFWTDDPSECFIPAG